MRIGQGYDVHKLVEGRKLILGGIEIPYEKGLLGHSDADVLVHAVMDALLGAATENIAEALHLDVSRVSIKATTEEGLGFTGTGEGISSQAITLLTEVADYCYDNKIINEGCGGCGGCCGPQK